MPRRGESLLFFCARVPTAGVRAGDWLLHQPAAHVGRWRYASSARNLTVTFCRRHLHPVAEHAHFATIQRWRRSQEHGGLGRSVDRAGDWDSHGNRCGGGLAASRAVLRTGTSTRAQVVLPKRLQDRQEVRKRDTPIRRAQVTHHRAQVGVRVAFLPIIALTERIQYVHDVR